MGDDSFRASVIPEYDSFAEKVRVYPLLVVNHLYSLVTPSVKVYFQLIEGSVDIIAEIHAVGRIVCEPFHISNSIYRHS